MPRVKTRYVALQELLAVLREAETATASVTFGPGFEVTGLDVSFRLAAEVGSQAPGPLVDLTPEQRAAALAELDEGMPDLAKDPAEAVRLKNAANRPD